MTLGAYFRATFFMLTFDMGYQLGYITKLFIANWAFLFGGKSLSTDTFEMFTVDIAVNRVFEDFPSFTVFQ